MRFPTATRIRNPYLSGDYGDPNAPLGSRERALWGMAPREKTGETEAEFEARVQRVMADDAARAGAAKRFAPVPDSELFKSVDDAVRSGSISETQGGEVLYGRGIGPAAEAGSMTNRFLRYWDCSTAKSGSALVPDNFAKGACYARNTGLVLGAFAGVFFLLYATKAIGD